MAERFTLPKPTTFILHGQRYYLSPDVKRYLNQDIHIIYYRYPLIWRREATKRERKCISQATLMELPHVLKLFKVDEMERVFEEESKLKEGDELGARILLDDGTKIQSFRFKNNSPRFYLETDIAAYFKLRTCLTNISKNLWRKKVSLHERATLHARGYICSTDSVLVKASEVHEILKENSNKFKKEASESSQSSSQNSLRVELPRKRKILKSIKTETEESDAKGSNSSSQLKVNKLSMIKSVSSLDAVAKSKATKNLEASNVAANLKSVYNAYCQKATQKELEDNEKQCLGPGCIYSARTRSSYCSDECGLALAERRLKYILPERIRAFYGEQPQSEIHDKKELQALAEEKYKLVKELQSLDQCADNVLDWISTLSTVQNCGSSATNMLVDDGSFMVTCAVCMMECSMRSIGKHMQRCFVRTERQNTYDTVQELSYNPRNLLCGVRNEIDGSNCKRLRVMCFDHQKEENEIMFCGAPLIWFDGKAAEFKKFFVNTEILSERMFCKEERKHCNVHHNWAQNALGLVDNERVNILHRLDENNNKRRKLQANLNTRGDVISLLCNRTTSGPLY